MQTLNKLCIYVQVLLFLPIMIRFVSENKVDETTSLHLTSVPLFLCAIYKQLNSFKYSRHFMNQYFIKKPRLFNSATVCGKLN